MSNELFNHKATVQCTAKNYFYLESIDAPPTKQQVGLYQIILVTFLAILLCIICTPSHADNYDNARALQQADKEVRDYQQARINGTYVDYSVTPSWVKALYLIVGGGFALAVIIPFLMSKKSDANTVELKVNISKLQIADTKIFRDALARGNPTEALVAMTDETMLALQQLRESSEDENKFLTEISVKSGISGDDLYMYMRGLKNIAIEYPEFGSNALMQMYNFSIFELFKDGKKADDSLRGGFAEVLNLRLKFAKQAELQPGSLISDIELSQAIKKELVIEASKIKANNYLLKSMQSAELIAQQIINSTKKFNANSFYSKYVNSKLPVINEIYIELLFPENKKFVIDLLNSNSKKFESLSTLVPIMQMKIDVDLEKKRIKAASKSSKKNQVNET